MVLTVRKVLQEQTDAMVPTVHKVLRVQLVLRVQQEQTEPAAVVESEQVMALER
jgi:hypothetical protein